MMFRILAGLVFLVASAGAQETAVAFIEGREVPRSEFDAFLENVNPLMEFDKLPASEQQRWLEEFVSRKLFALEARKAGLEDTPEIRAKIAFFTEGILAQAYREAAAKKITVEDAEVTRYYEANREQFRSAPRVRAQHAIARTESAAKDVLQRWQAGASLEEIAGLRRKEPGILTVERGWFSSAVLPSSLFEHLLAANREWVGPVQSAYGWHAFRIEEREPSRLRALEEVEPEIRERLRQEKAQRVYAELLEQAKKSRGLKIPLQGH